MKPCAPIPEPGDQIERWGNALTSWFGRTVLRMWGWRIEPGPPNLPKFVAVVAPHTSNLDFFVGMAAILAMRMRAYWMAKHTLFRPAFLGCLLESLGGIPIDRTASRGVVEQMAQRLRESDRLVLGVTPEATRKRNAHWKTGFHHIAKSAGVPIVLVSFDYREKCLGFGAILHPDDLAADMQEIRAFFRPITARRPGHFALPERSQSEDGEQPVQGPAS